MMDGKPDLRPCPFCGGHGVKVLELIRGGVCYALCDICKAATRCFDTPKNAAEAWNRRAEPENRVLTLEEATGSEDPVWLETRKTLRVTDVCIAADFRYAEVYTTGSRIPYLMFLDSYGQTWRCWLRKPTPEQMANAPWWE